MTVGQQSQQKTIHQILLPDHNVTDLLPERWNPLAQFSYFLRNFLRRFHTVCSDSLAARTFDQTSCMVLVIVLLCPARNVLKVSQECQPYNHGIEQF
jgi:hypothetical protein